MNTVFDFHRIGRDEDAPLGVDSVISSNFLSCRVFPVPDCLSML